MSSSVYDFLACGWQWRAEGSSGRPVQPALIEPIGEEILRLESYAYRPPGPDRELADELISFTLSLRLAYVF